MPTERVQVVAIAVSVVLLVLVLDLVRRRKLVEEYSVVWILAAAALLGISVWRGLLDELARRFGVFYPPSLLLLVVVAMVFVGLLWFSVVLSTQRKQIDRLIEDLAILQAELRDRVGETAVQPGPGSVQGRAAEPAVGDRTAASGPPDTTG